LVRAFTAFREHQMTDRAAALTYYAMMSLFPALLLAIALLGALGQAQTVTDIVNYLARKGAAPELVSSIRTILSTAVDSTGGAISGALIAGLVGSVYGASGGFGAAGRALNAVYGVEDDRPFLRRKAWEIACTLVVILLAVTIVVLIFLGGGAARDLFGTIGLGSTATSIWNVARWPAAGALTMVAYGFVYAAAPNVRPRRFRSSSPGALAGVVIWILASAGFFIYIQYVTHHAYGVLGAAVLLLLWLWLSSVALLFGAEVNVVVETPVPSAPAPDRPA
jgi:membrane protein